MRTRRFYSLLVVIITGISISRPVFAEPIVILDVVQAFSTVHNAPDLNLRSLSNGTVPIIDSLQSNSSPRTVIRTSTIRTDLAVGFPGLTTGLDFKDLQQKQDPQKAPQGDVEAALCDCGEVLLPVGGFPKWPLLFLAGIPLFFIPGGDHDTVPPVVPPPGPTPVPTPVPTPPPQTVPEAMSLLLLLSGVCGLGLRQKMSSRKRKTGRP